MMEDAVVRADRPVTDGTPPMLSHPAGQLHKGILLRPSREVPPSSLLVDVTLHLLMSVYLW